MNASTVTRRPDGTVLPGSLLNPGGRPRTAIEELRAKYLPRLPEFMDRLVDLTQSPNELTRLAALREVFDRLLGKPAVFVDATHTKVDIASLYLQALKQVNAVPAGSTIDANPNVPAESTTSCDDGPW
jgi:hypothetical protein